MPITQHRMLSVIAAARDFEQNYNGLTQAIVFAITRARAKPESALDELEGLQAAILSTTPKTRTAVTIAVEHEHFKKAYKINERNARIQANRRLLSGVEPMRKKTLEELVELTAKPIRATVPKPCDTSNDLGEVTMVPDENTKGLEKIEGTGFTLDEEDQWPELTQEQKDALSESADKEMERSKDYDHE